MANRYYRSGNERASQVRALFATIAGRYDLINDLQSFGLHRYWKSRMLKEASVKPHLQVLDVCTGTGDIALRLQTTGASTVAVDFSLPMLQRARERSRSLNQYIPWLAADALKLPFRDTQFDRVTIAYGLRNLPDFAAGLRELQRVTKPGGKLVVLDFGKPSSTIWRAFYFAYLRLALPILGRIICGDSEAYAYILESLKNYPDYRSLTELLQQNGWRNTRVTQFMGGIMTLHSAEKAATQ